MNDEHPQQGAADIDQDHSSERAVAAAPARDDARAADALGGPPATGDARVDGALAGLSRLPGRPAEEHVAVLEEVHGRLRDILDELAENQGSQG
jgi:hypothetical protein